VRVTMASTISTPPSRGGWKNSSATVCGDGSRAEPSNTYFRLITVSHLSANVAKLLGGLYNIHADFFNRHFPGTEAISGRLLSRVSSAIQIEFDELYETNADFQSLWGQLGHDMNGHDFIKD